MKIHSASFDRFPPVFDLEGTTARTAREERIELQVDYSTHRGDRDRTIRGEYSSNRDDS
jgi:hypothetical protein